MPNENKSPVSPAVYTELAKTYRLKGKELRARLAWLSVSRLFLFIAFIYLGYRSFASGQSLFIVLTLVALAGFLVLIRIYDRLQRETKFYEALVRINEDEAGFLATGKSVYSAGKEFIDPLHPYSYDLDLFGEDGLFQHLNRCSTSFGKEALAAALLDPDTGLINARQDAIQELKEKREFRQHLQAMGLLLDSREKEKRQLNDWLSAPALFKNRILYFALLIFPLTTMGLLLHYLFTQYGPSLEYFYRSFVINLVVALSFGRMISKHLSVSTSVTNILQQYAGQLKQLETEKFESPLLLKLQSDLKTGGINASDSIARLASLFNYLETIVNLVVSLLLNGLFIFHVHVLFFLEKWKKDNGAKVKPWLQLLGEMEALNSLSNLSANNPSFARPVLSESETLSAVDMGHPLIRASKRINNSISFENERFVILTGSNMSGKSTFLRTLGINLVLARTGADVCAESFVFYPYRVHVSMRISDSLQDSESFFYAELKRLQSIIAELQQGRKTLVILDEILRGTNSNDKQKGTIGLVNKLVAAGATGIIATHDITVSGLKEIHPDYIGNQCFESEIINDELVFDYKLKPGVCSTLSATFLMKKMGVIE